MKESVSVQDKLEDLLSSTMRVSQLPYTHFLSCTLLHNGVKPVYGRTL